MRVGRVAQPIVEPRLEDVLAVIERRVRSEVDRAEPSAIAVPSAMIPRSRHEIVATIAIVGLHLLVDLLRSVEILLIPPAGHMHDRDLYSVEIGSERQPLPERIVIGVMEEILPSGQLSVEILLVRIGERSEIQIPIVGVAAIELEAVIFGRTGLQHRGVFEALAQAKSAVVMKVVAQ